MHRLSSPSRPILSFMASAPTGWWPPALARRVFPLMAPNTPVRRVSRFPSGSRNMATVSRIKGVEFGKPYRRLCISSSNVIITSQGNKHSAITQGMKNIETRGTNSEVLDEDEISDKDACNTSEVIDGKRDTLGQIVNLIGCEEDQRSATEDPRGEVIASDDEEDSDDEGYTINNILAKSRHRDGSIYRGMDLWWKKEYRIADRNEKILETIVYKEPCGIASRVIPPDLHRLAVFQL